MCCNLSSLGGVAESRLTIWYCRVGEQHLHRTELKLHDLHTGYCKPSCWWDSYLPVPHQSLKVPFCHPCACLSHLYLDLLVTSQCVAPTCLSGNSDRPWIPTTLDNFSGHVVVISKEFQNITVYFCCWLSQFNLSTRLPARQTDAGRNWNWTIHIVGAWHLKF